MILKCILPSSLLLKEDLPESGANKVIVKPYILSQLITSATAHLSIFCWKF